MEQEHSRYGSVALIVGATGMVGLCLAEALKKPSAPGGPWKVYGSARRQLPTWYPSSTLDRFIAFDATDATDTNEKLSPISAEITHLFWVAIQVRDTEEANIAVNSAMLGNVVKVLVKKPSSLRHVTLQTGTKQYMGPIFDPELGQKIAHHESPFKESMPRLPYPNFYYALEDLLASHAPSFTYSIHRSSVIAGASSASFYNCLLTLFVYAIICKHDGSKFRFPGGKFAWEHFWDMSDARVLAEQQIWAATDERAKNQAFNCTNGDVFTWKRLWREVCEIFEVEFVELNDETESESNNWVEEMNQKAGVWDKIVADHGLFKTKLEEIACFGAVKVVLDLRIQHVCCMNKSREFGFFGFADSIKGIRFWASRMRQMKLIPSE